MAEAKKHHYVPQFLLRRFADTGERLLVVRTDADRQYVGSVRDVGHENQGHTLFWPDRAPDRTSLEARMADLEGAANQVVDELLSTRTRVLSDEQRETLAFFVALQWSRSRFLLALVRRKVLDGEPPEEVAADRDSRRSIGLINILVSVLDPWAARRAGAFDPKETYCSIVSMLWGWSWHVFRPRAGELIVGDNLVCMSGTAPGHEAASPQVWARHGVGVGFGTCARITVPFGP